MKEIKVSRGFTTARFSWVPGVALGFALVLSGCQINPAVLATDRAYDVVWREYESYVLADPTLDEDEKEERMRTVRARAFELKKREELLEETGGAE